MYTFFNLIIILSVFIFTYADLFLESLRLDDLLLVTPIYAKRDELMFWTVIYKDEKNDIDKVIRRYCRKHSLPMQTCLQITEFCEDKASKCDEETCGLSYWFSSCQKPKQECMQELEQIIASRPLSYDIPELVLPRNMSVMTMQAMKDFAELLTDRACSSKFATASLQNYFFANDSNSPITWNSDALYLWQHPVKSVWRDMSKVTVPCDERFWVRGSWFVRPMWAHALKETSVTRCQQNVTELEALNCPLMAGLRGECSATWLLHCTEMFSSTSQISGVKNDASISLNGDSEISIRNSNHNSFDDKDQSCLVYSVRDPLLIDWSFEVAMIKQHDCEVYVFLTSEVDVSVCDGLNTFMSLPNAHVHQLNNADYRTSDSPDIVSWNSILRSLGHESRTIDVMKASCAGCEWQLLSDMTMKENSTIISHMRYLNLELHVCEALMSQHPMDSTSRIDQMSEVWKHLIVERKFHFWHRHFRPNTDRNMKLIDLLDLFNFPSQICVYDVGLTNTLFGTDKSIDYVSNIHDSMAFSLKYWAVQVPQRTEEDFRVMKQDLRSATIERHRLFDGTNSQLPGHNSYLDSHNYIRKAKLTIAVTQLDNTIHSEMVGPIMQLAQSIGSVKVILYYDFNRSDDMNMIPYMDKWSDWDVRQTSRWIEESDVWDVTIFTTGDEVYRFHPGFYELYSKVSHRVIAIHHHPYWHIPSAIPKYLLLTPVYSSDKYIFPLFDPLPKYVVDADIGQVQTRTLFILGHIPWIGKGSVLPKTKDVPDMLRYLEADPKNFLVNIARSPGAFDSLMEKYPLQCLGLWAQRTEDLFELTSQLSTMWVPIPEDSLYMRGVFASSLAFGISSLKTMIMPRHLANLFGMSGVVVEYENSIVEVDFDKIDHLYYRERMIEWIRHRKVQNEMNLMKCILMSCD